MASAMKPGGSRLRLLLVSHDLQRSGAPLALLIYARWLAEQGEQVQFLALDGGELDTDFAATGPLHCLPRLLRVLMRHPRFVWARPVARFIFDRWLGVKFSTFDVVHANTTSSAWITPHFSRLNAPVVAHIHELPFWIEHHTGDRDMKAMLEACDDLICVTGRTREYLVEKYGVAAERIGVVPPMVPRRAVAARRREEVRAGLGISADTFVIGGCGTIDWRKGPDLFVRVAAELHRAGDAPWVLLWVGGDPASLEMAQLRHDISRAGLQGRVRFLGPLDDPVASGWYSALDAFALTSREDPFPLVMQEAAGARLPVVGFAGSGGVEEFITAGSTGELVGYGDCRAMSEVLSHWMHDPARAARQGAAGYERLVRDYDPDAIGRELRAVSVAARARHLGPGSPTSAPAA